MSLKIHLKRREKNQWRKLCWKKELDCFILFYLNESQRKSFCVSKSPLAWRDAEKRKREWKKERNIENRIETELFASSAAKVELLEECFFFTHYHLEPEETKRGVRLLLENFIRIEKNPILPLEKGPTSSSPPNWHAEEKTRKNDLILKPHVPYLGTHQPRKSKLLFSTFLWKQQNKS